MKNFINALKIVILLSLVAAIITAEVIWKVDTTSIICLTIIFAIVAVVLFTQIFGSFSIKIGSFEISFKRPKDDSTTEQSPATTPQLHGVKQHEVRLPFHEALRTWCFTEGIQEYEANSKLSLSMIDSFAGIVKTARQKGFDYHHDSLYKHLHGLFVEAIYDDFRSKVKGDPNNFDWNLLKENMLAYPDYPETWRALQADMIDKVNDRLSVVQAFEYVRHQLDKIY